MDKELLENRNSFMINAEHADIIANEMLENDDKALGRIFRDLINFNVHGDYTLIERECSKLEKSARRFFFKDSEFYIDAWIRKSEQNSKNRKAKQIPTQEEFIDYADSKGYDNDTALKWYERHEEKNWIGDNTGEQIRYWKKSLDAYMQGVNRNKIVDFTNKLTNKNISSSISADEYERLTGESIYK